MNISKYSNSCENAKVPIADLNPGRIFSCDGNLYMKIENGSEDAKCISLDSGILVYIKRNYYFCKKINNENIHRIRK